MLSIRGCPHCGETPEIKVIIRDYGFNGVVIECPNCKAQIRNAKCSEMIIRPEDGAFSTPITEESLGHCLWEAIKAWNRRNKKANAEVEG